MSGDRWTDRLSDYLDGHMDPGERAELEAHLRGCAACRSALADLETLVAAAGTLPAAEPPRDLWPGIAAAMAAQDETAVIPLHAAPGPRPARFSMPRLAAAAVAVVALGSAGVWLARSGVPVDGGAPLPPAASGPVSLTAVPAVEEQDYQAALDRLERTLAERRDELDPATVRVVEESMAIIDAALAEAEAALAADPASPYLNRHYDATMRKKIELLRRAANAERAVS